MKKKIILFIFLLATLQLFSTNYKNWKEVKKNARGQTVYFYAWGGLESINNYLSWSAKQIKKKYGIEFKHVKVTDMALTVKQILTEKKIGTPKGNVDLVWINGENFKTMKTHKLLFKLNKYIPNNRLVDYKNNLSASVDFSESVDGLEIPWGTAKLVFIHDSKKITPPHNYIDLLNFTKKKPGRFTYPAPPEFHGTTFLKQMLIEIIGNNQNKQKSLSQATDQNNKKFQSITRPLWKYLDKLHPNLWSQGKNFPSSLGMLNQLFSDSEILISLSFNPNSVNNQILNGDLPKSTRIHIHNGGSIGNTHFLAIPINSTAKEAALVAINFLISPDAQSRKANPQYWGDPTVLNMDLLTKKEKVFFKKIEANSIGQNNLGETFLEPHSSWTEALEKEWIKRYSK